MLDAAIVASVRNFLRAVQASGIAVDHGVVFGSQATGQARAESDIDLLVVSPRFDGPRDRAEAQSLWRLAARTDSRIEPIPCGQRQYAEDDSSMIVELARRHGVRVDLLDRTPG